MTFQERKQRAIEDIEREKQFKEQPINKLFDNPYYWVIEHMGYFEIKKQGMFGYYKVGEFSK